MDKTNEIYYLNKYKYISENNSQKKEEEKNKKENEIHLKKLKELKKKRMQELCQQKSKKTSPNISNAKKYVDKTKPGEKKDISGEFPEYYAPTYVESAWNAWWKKEEFFKIEFKEAIKKPRDQRFVMLLPPPNVTGTLHLGHALMSTIEDAIICFFMGSWC